MDVSDEAMRAAGQALYDMRMGDGDEFATLLFSSSYTGHCETVQEVAAHSKLLCTNMALTTFRAYLRALPAPDKRTLASALLRLAAEVDGEDWRVVPAEPSRGLLMSMALRADHGLACPGYYDQFQGETGYHARRLDMALTDARRAHEEVVGNGFYRPEKEAEYAAMAPAPKGDGA